MNSFLDVGSSESADIIASTDWSTTPLGPMAAWPPALKIVVNLVLGSRFPKAVIWGPGLITLHNDAFRPLLGAKPQAIGRSFADVWAEAWDEIVPLVERAFAGEATFIENFPLTIQRNGFEEEAFFTFCYSPIHDETGAVVGMMDTVIETTATVHAQRQLEAVNAELAHRMRNLVTMAGALASQTLRGAPEVEERRDEYLRRLAVLGDAHILLAGDNHPEVTMMQLVDAVLAPRVVEPERVTYAGADVVLQGRHAMPLALALNELLTNAVKYGALSNRAGSVEIRWEIEDGEFSFRWQETGGPLVSVPTRSGFGSTLINRFAAAALNGKAEVQYLPEGLRYELRTNINALTA